MIYVFQEWLDNDGYPFWSFWENIKTWWDASNLPNVMLIHYSELKRDLPGEIRKIAEFINVPIDDNNFDAMLTIGYKALDENYTSRVKGAYLKQIESKAISGPFKYLDSIWIFNKYGKSNQ